MKDPEVRAYELLQWIPFSLSADFHEHLAREGYYTHLQRQRSDQALAIWEQHHPHVSSAELTAFRELERLGHLNQSDFYSPAKAKDEHYTRLLDQLRGNRERPGRDQAAQKGFALLSRGLPGRGPYAKSTRSSERPRLKRRNPRC